MGYDSKNLVLIGRYYPNSTKCTRFIITIIIIIITIIGNYTISLMQGI
jgi:hypothetical protein